MRLFSARLDIKDSSKIDGNRFNLEAVIVDNIGLFYANEVKVGDIIYVSAINCGYSIFRYVVSEITKAEGANISCVVKWDLEDQDIEVTRPFGDAIIGSRQGNSNTANIADASISLANEKLINDARNYQQLITNIEKVDNSSLASRIAVLEKIEKHRIEF